MPKRRRSLVLASAPSVDPLPTQHELVHCSTVVKAWGANRHAASFYSQGYCHGLRCAARAAGRALPDGSKPRPFTMCKQCKVHLCKVCFNDAARWCHATHARPSATILAP